MLTYFEWVSPEFQVIFPARLFDITHIRSKSTVFEQLRGEHSTLFT